MALVAAADVLKFLELAADDSFGGVAAIQAGVEASIKTYCRRNFESKTYKDIYSDKINNIVLKDYPITSITKICKNVITPAYITNTNQYTSAIVNTTDTTIVLKYNGVTTAGNFTFATNTTMSSMATAISAAGSGWQCVVIAAQFDGVLTSEIVPMFGQSAIWNYRLPLLIPYIDFNDVDVDEVRGIIKRPGGFAGEFDNVYVYYTAGYSTIPDDIQYAVKLWVKDVYTKQQEDAVGLKEYWFAGIRKYFEDIPAQVLIILNRHKRVLV